MDNAVALVQAYLRVSGYFTVSEYPIVEAMGPDRYRSATDLDILALGHVIHLLQSYLRDHWELLRHA